MQKKIIKKLKKAVDAETIEEIMSKLKSLEVKNSKIEVNEKEKEELINYLELMRIMLTDLEHSKITISKLQKLFGYYSEKITSKEV
jgi:3-dehydroquinate dehydratase